jgi:uncharacterized protein YjbI with pentapeptide repeats
MGVLAAACASALLVVEPSARAHDPQGDAIIANGTVQLGVHPFGHVNVPGGSPSSGAGETTVGLRFLPTNADAISPACDCEGWGVADAGTGRTAYANQNEIPNVNNLVVESFASSATGATSVVRDVPIEGNPFFRVTHAFAPAAETPNLYKVTVSIENLRGSAITDLRYRRVMDWDVEPTPFNEFVTINGTAPPELLYSNNNGFATANPLGSRTAGLPAADLQVSLPEGGPLNDAGPRDHGALFDFGFGSLPAGETKTFTFYYGGAASETAALAAVDAVGADLYSLGQPNTDGGATGGTPNTFIFAYASPRVSDLTFEAAQTSVIAGAEEVSISSIPPAAVRGGAVQGTAVENIALENIPVDNIPVENIALENIPVENIPIDNIGFTAAMLAEALGGVHLSDIPLSTPGGWDTVLAGTRLAGVPLSTVTLADVYALPDPPTDGITLGQIDLSNTALENIGLGAIAIGPLALENIPIDGGTTPDENRQDWCAYLQTQGLACTATSPATLIEATLQGLALENIPVDNIPVENIDLSGTALENIAVENIDLSGTALENIAVENIDIVGTALENIAVENIGPGIVDTGKAGCSGVATLGAAVANDCLFPDLTLDDLVDALLPGAGVSLAELAEALPAGTPLGDLLAVLLAATPVENIAVENIDLSGTALENIAVENIDIGGTALENIPVENIGPGIVDTGKAGCGGVATLGAAVANDCLFPNLTLDHLVGALLPGTGASVGDLLQAVALENIDLSGTALENIAVENIDIAGTALENIAVENIGAGIIDVGKAGCSGVATLGEAAANDCLLPNLTLDHLVDALLPGAGVTLADLAESLPAGASLRDLFFAAAYDWNNLPLDGSFPIQDFARAGGVITYEANFNVSGTGEPTPMTLEATLPAGVRYKRGSATLTRNGVEVPIGEPQQSAGSLKLTWQTEASFGDVYQLRFQVRPGLALGVSSADLKVVVSGLPPAVAAAPPVKIEQTLEATGPNPADSPVLEEDVLYFGHITHGDSDYLQIPIPSEFGSRTTIDLTHLPADYDLVVFGPEVPSVAPSAVENIPLGNEPLVDSEVSLAQHTQPLQPETLQDIAVENIGPETTLRATSDNRGTANEHLELISLGEEGVYTIRIDPYEDAKSPQPFMLRIGQTGPPQLGSCAPRDFEFEGTAGAAASIPPGVNTLFLVNKKRLGDTYGATTAANVMAKLGELASRQDLGVTSAVIPVEAAFSFPGVDVPAAYTAWDANPCSPALAQSVALEITELLDNLITPAMEDEIENVVIVGGDDIIPMGRVPDTTEIANERTYANALGSVNNQFVGSFGYGFLMTDDLYGDRDPKEWFGRQLYVPERALGRLVEEPPEIMAQVDQFIARQGRITPTTSLVTGYDFLIDGAEAVNAAFVGFGAGANTLIDGNWSRQTLIDNMFPASGTPPQVNSINAHFDHRRALPADQDAADKQDDLFTTDDIPAGSLDGRLLFTMGCHSGFAAANAVFGLNALSSDFAETAAANGAVSYIGNTGYGLGDTVIVGYSERLHALFAAALRGRTIGKALVTAKQQYIGIGAGSVLTLYDEKVSVEATNYGLPMYRYGPDVPKEEAEDPLPVTTDPVTGLQSASFDEHPFGEPAVLNPVSTANGEYFKVDGEPLGGIEVTPRRPIQPLTVLDVTQAPSVGLAHGAILEHLESALDFTGFDAAWSRVEIDSVGAAPELVGEGASSSKLQAVTTIDIPGGSLQQQLLLLAGQFRSDGVPDPQGIGVQTVFTEEAGKVYYSSSPDFVPPQFGAVDIFRIDGGSGSTIGFAVDVTDRDHNGNPGTVKRVVALYRDCNNVWRKAEFSKSVASNRWSGGGPISGSCDAVSYFIQAVDAAGNVGVTSRKTIHVDIEVDPPDPNASITASLSGTEHASGWFKSSVSVTLTASNESVEIEYSLDGAPFQDYTGAFTVTGDGVHTIEFRGSNAFEGLAVVPIDTAGPTILITKPKDGAKYVLNSTVPADYTCPDAGSGAQTCSGTTPLGQPINTSSLGTKTFTVNATDAVGNAASKEVTYEVIRRPILFASSRSGNGDIYAIDPHAATPTPPVQLTDSPAIDAEPEWFPNGDRIVFSSSRSGNGDIYSMESDGDSLDQLTSHSAIDTSPAVSPDGSKIAFSSNRGSGNNWDIYVMNADGSNVERLTTHNQEDLLPAWSSDGTQIAFMSTRTGKGDIYTMNANGTVQTRRATSSGIDTEPAWFGNTIAFSTNRHGDSNFEIYTMTSTGASQTRRTQQPGHDVTPAWSVDGARLAFATNRAPAGGANFNVWTMNPNGSGQTPLVTHGAADVFPDW